MTSWQCSKYRDRSSRTASASRLSASVVNPTRSANRTVTRRRSETVAGVRGTPVSLPVVAAAEAGAGVPHTLQKRAPSISGVPHPVHPGVIDEPQLGQNRASAGAASPHLEQVIRDRVPNPRHTTARLHDYSVELYSHSTVTTT